MGGTNRGLSKKNVILPCSIISLGPARQSLEIQAKGTNIAFNNAFGNPT
jgi:hypothetical protein